MSVPIAIVILVVAVIGTIVYTAREDQAEGLATLAGSAVDPASLPRTIPFDYLAGHIVVEVAIGERGGTFPMLLDTGAPTVVAADIAAAFGGRPEGTLTTTSVDGQVENRDVVSLPALGIGGARFRDVGAVSGYLEAGHPLACLSSHGLVGASLMRAGVWQIDYAGRLLTIATSTAGLDHVEGAIVLPFTPAGSSSPSPMVELPAGDGTLRLLVDTGSSGWLAAHPADLEAVGIVTPPDAPALVALAAGVAGTFETRLAVAAADVTLDGRHRSRLPIVATTSLTEGRGSIGNDFLDDFVVTIDWTAQVLYLAPVTPEPRPSPPPSVGLGWDDGAYVVGSFVEGAPGTDGLRLRDRIEAIDGTDVVAATFDDYCARLTRRPDVGLEMSVAGKPPIPLVVAPVDDFFERSVP